MSKDATVHKTQQMFFSVDQLSRRYGVSARQVRRWIDDGALPVHRFGKLVRVSMKDAVVFEAQRASKF